MSDSNRRVTDGDAKSLRGSVIADVECFDFNNLGYGVAKLGEGTADAGKIVFVRGAIKGDRVRVQVIKNNRDFAVGRLIEILNPSPYRAQTAFCDAPNMCGGCIFRNYGYADELVCKREYVESAFAKAGVQGVNVLPCASTGMYCGYRNKAMYPVAPSRNGMVAGFYAVKTHKVVPAADCRLQPAVFSRIVKAICAFCDRNRVPAYDEVTGTGYLRHIYLRSSGLGKVLVCLVVTGRDGRFDKKKQSDFVSEMTAGFPEISGIMLNINPDDTNVVLGDGFRLLYGDACLEDVLCGIRIKIAPDAFYQVNHDGAELLYTVAADMAGLSGNENLWDLYCGVGTIGLSMANRVGSLTGIEIVEPAVINARENADVNIREGRIKPLDTAFYCADAGNPASLFSPTDRGERPFPDVLILDPPRKGTTPELIAEIAARRVPKILYISCNPETLARDCALFTAAGYAIGDVQPVDMFPRTGHVESVVQISKNNI